MSDWIAVVAMVVVAAGLPVGLLLGSWLLRPSVPERQKSTTYESGEIPTGDTRIRFSIQYYLVALLFLLFDVETLLVVPWAVVVADKPESFAPAVVFVAILFVGIGWAWRVGGIEWLKPTPSGEVT